jgi:drug/metabolite transporter (DMT)-like permease
MAEKQESLVFCLIGIAALLVAAGFFFLWKTNFGKGAAIPLLVIGLVQAIVGYAVYARSDEQRIGNVYAADMNPVKLRNEELPRIRSVIKNFVVYRFVEILFILAGIALVIIFRNQQARSFFAGLGLSLAIQSLLMLGADSLAGKRALVYSRQLEIFLKK